MNSKYASIYSINTIAVWAWTFCKMELSQFSVIMKENQTSSQIKLMICQKLIKALCLLALVALLIIQAAQCFRKYVQVPLYVSSDIVDQNKGMD